MRNHIFITGATGFLGAHITKKLLEQGCRVSAWIRSSSDLWRCRDVQQQINWIDSEQGDEHIIPIIRDCSIVIHCAWSGVTATDRDDQQVQRRNLEILNRIFRLTAVSDIKKFICLGSQAEYGNYNGIVDESMPVNPVSAYAKTKIEVQLLLKQYCEERQIHWIWLRVFSVFGPMEEESWFIPMLIKKMLNSEPIPMTAGEQKYAYLYIRDFCEIMAKVATEEIQSGIYNVCAPDIMSIRELAQKIKKLLQSDAPINFGEIPYRPNQAMLMKGSINKLLEQIGEIHFTDINLALSETIKHYSV